MVGSVLLLQLLIRTSHRRQKTLQTLQSWLRRERERRRSPQRWWGRWGEGREQGQWVIVSTERRRNCSRKEWPLHKINSQVSSLPPSVPPSDTSCLLDASRVPSSPTAAAATGGQVGGRGLALSGGDIEDYDMETEETSQTSLDSANEEGQSLPSTADSGYDTHSAPQTESQDMDTPSSLPPLSLSSSLPPTTTLLSPSPTHTPPLPTSGEN